VPPALIFEEFLFRKENGRGYPLTMRLAGPRIFEKVFVDSQSLDFRVERTRWQPQFGRGAGWARDPALAFRQCSFNHFLFLSLQRAGKHGLLPGRLGRLAHEPSFVNRESITVAQDNGPLDYVLQFTNVAWPLVGFE
jgi:hypothetical protein